MAQPIFPSERSIVVPLQQQVDMFSANVKATLVALQSAFQPLFVAVSPMLFSRSCEVHVDPNYILSADLQYLWRIRPFPKEVVLLRNSRNSVGMQVCVHQRYCESVQPPSTSI